MNKVKHQHILVIRFSALGDVAMTVPIVWAVAKRYPNVRITMLSRPFARPFFENLAPNVNFMEADLKSEYKGIHGLNALYRRLTAKQFTHVADLHSVLRSEYLRMRFNLGHFKVKHIDKHRKMRRMLVKHNHKQKKYLPTAFENYTDVFTRLGFPINENDFRSIFQEESSYLNTLPDVIGEKHDDELWIGVAPFAAHLGKIYPPELMEQVIRQLTERYPKCRIFLFGRGKQEDESFPKWTKEIPQCTNVGLHLETMRQELILMAHLNVMLSMDSANMHMASLTSTKVVSVWGATHPMAGFMGWRQNEENAIQLDMDCRPCSIFGQKPCMYGDYRCLTGIKPEIIVEKISNIINF